MLTGKTSQHNCRGDGRGRAFLLELGSGNFMLKDPALSQWATFTGCKPRSEGLPQTGTQEADTMHEWSTGVLLCLYLVISQYDVVTALRVPCLGEGGRLCWILRGLWRILADSDNMPTVPALAWGLQPRRRKRVSRKCMVEGHAEGLGVFPFSNASCHYRKL